VPGEPTPLSGGGRGTLLAAILAAHPHARGVLFDVPQVVDGGRDLLEAAGVAGRCTLVGGDFLASVPGGGDTYILKWVLHDWDDARAATILRHCRRAMPAGSRLLLIERVVPPGTATAAHQQALWADVHMLVLFGGRERTAEQFARLLDRAGFRLGQVRPVDSGLSLLEGIPSEPKER
jgi:O-methyltransferase domain